MLIAVISDLHLGAADRVDGFGHDDGEFLRFLSFLEQNFERVVLLGDIWETLTSAHYGGARQALARAREAHPEIAQRFRQPRYSYVHGNHDLIAGLSDGAPDELTLDVDGSRLLFTHGHHYDLLVRNARWLSELGVWLGGWMLRLRMNPLYALFNSLDSWRYSSAQDPALCTFQRWVMSAAGPRGADVVVTGHTHQATRTEHASGLFLNSGSCANGNYSYLSLDTRSARYDVHSSW
ncbi:MAG TPA: metallophosphoesterase family protein [Polyangiaceae bacterium]|nr:metallophosphoesterase family protein [Polyangiaceae bacterium]